MGGRIMTGVRGGVVGLVGLFGVSLGSLPAGAGAEGAAGSYPLAQAWRDALARDARLHVAAGQVAQARARVGEVASERRPSLSATGQLGHVYNRNEARRAVVYAGRSARGTLYLSQPLYTFGRLTGRTAQAEAELAGAEAAAAELRQTVLAEVTQRYAETVYQGRMFALQQTFAELTAALEASARTRLTLKAGERTEVHELARRRHRATAARVEAGARYRTATTRLTRLTGIAPAPITVAALETLPATMPTSLDAALAQARQHAPVLVQARARLAAAEGELAVRRAELWPTLSLEVQARTGQVSDIAIFNVGSGLIVDVPLYEGGLLRAQVQTARAAVSTARWELAAEQERVETETQAQWELIASQVLAVQDLTQAVGEAQAAAGLIRDKLAAGRATVVAEMDARQAVVRAEHDVLDARLRLAIARIDLLRLLAALGPDG